MGGVQLFCKTMAIVMLSSGSEDPVVTVTVEEAGLGHRKWGVVEAKILKAACRL